MANSSDYSFGSVNNEKKMVSITLEPLIIQCWHLAVWPGLAIGRLANLAGQNGQKNLWPRPNANLLLINYSFGQNLARVGHWPAKPAKKIFGRGQMPTLG